MSTNVNAYKRVFDEYGKNDTSVFELVQLGGTTSTMYTCRFFWLPASRASCLLIFWVRSRVFGPKRRILSSFAGFVLSTTIH